MPELQEPAERDRAPGQMALGSSIVSLKTLATIVAVCAILALAKDLFLPLALGMLFAFILSPVVTFLRRFGLGDTVAVVTTVCAAAGFVGLFFLILGYQVGQIGANLPQYQGNVLAKIDALLDVGTDNRVVSHLRVLIEGISNRIAGEAANDGTAPVQVEVVNQDGVWEWMTGLVLPAISPLAIFGLIIVVVIFALLERQTLRDRLVQLIGGTNILATSELLAEAAARVATYLFAQLAVNIIYAVPIWLGLWLVGVPNALFFGLVTLVLRFVPYIGSAISAILPLLMALAVSPDWSLVLWVAALFLTVELVTSNFIEPWFYGQRTGLSPLAVIVSAIFWTWLWGPMGLIMATPLTVCLVVIGHHVPSLRLFPIMFSDQPGLADSARLYDRLLAGRALDSAEAPVLSNDPQDLARYYDETAIPALALAQADHQAGLLSEEQRQRIAHAAWDLTNDLETLVEDQISSATPPGADPDPAPGSAPPPARIAVIGAQTQLDDIAAHMLAQVLRAVGGAEATALAQRPGLPTALRDLQPQVLVVLSLGPVGVRAIDLHIRRLRRHLPDAKIGLALWADRDADHRPPKGAADFVALGLDDMLQKALHLPLAEREKTKTVS